MDLLRLPPIFLLTTHLQPEEIAHFESFIPSLTYDANEAVIVLGKIAKRERALFELRRLRLETEPLESISRTRTGSSSPEASSDGKRRKLCPSDGESDVDAMKTLRSSDNNIAVIRLSWLIDSIEEERMLSFENYLLYYGRKIQKNRPKSAVTMKTKEIGAGILTRAQRDNPLPQHSQERQPQEGPLKFSTGQEQGSHLLVTPTTSFSLQSFTDNIALPLIPEYLQTTYSCHFQTQMNNPNSEFIEQLKELRILRQLQGDRIGVRAYSTCIATLSAYPHPVRSPQEISRLPGCSHKIAALFQQWSDGGGLREVVDARNDPKIEVLQLFYKIWGVGDSTARDFYKQGWRSLDDLVEHAWSSLSRVQQIGIKYYDEFLAKIPRIEAEEIASEVLRHARRIDPGYQMIIVGGYRRGKQESGDVDVMLSHMSEESTFLLIEKLVASLEESKYITHALTLSTRNSERNQQTLPWRGEGIRGSGFDTLDKALVVWQDPHHKGSQPAPHRRVDIIISPWKTVGCAILGWSGDTTFERDIRRYCKVKKRLKFDSSGIRSRANGEWMDLEIRSGRRATTMEEAEKWVFEALDLEYRQPEERCTG